MRAGLLSDLESRRNRWGESDHGQRVKIRAEAPHPFGLCPSSIDHEDHELFICREKLLSSRWLHDTQIGRTDAGVKHHAEIFGIFNDPIHFFMVSKIEAFKESGIF